MGHQSEESLTPRQVQSLRTIAGFRSSRGYLPTIGELAAQLSISRTTAFEHIEQLRQKGLVSHRPGRARSLSLTSKARRLLSQISDRRQQYVDESVDGIPLVGTVAAGLPAEAIESRQNISFESCFGNGGDVFALEVRGDSMVGEDIQPGDYVICRRAETAQNGRLVVALVHEGQATLKRFYREQDRARLQPANPNYAPIYSDDCRINAVVVGLLRKL